MSIQPSIPFSLTPGGTVSVDTDPDIQISKRIRTLVSTQPGERVVRNTYGVPLAGLLFEPEDDAQGELEEYVTQALATWEPGVEVNVVSPVWNKDGDTIVAVDVDFTRTESPDSPISIAQQINTAVISTDGTVTETVVG